MKTLYQLFVLLLLSSSLSAQSFKVSKYLSIEDSTQIHVLETYRGDVFKGRVLEMDEEKIRFLTIGLKELYFKLYEVRGVLVEGKGEMKRRNDKLKYEKTPQLTTITSSTAFMLPKGRYIYQNIDLFWNSFDVGLGKGFTIGAVWLVPIFFNLKGKYSYAIGENIHLGADVNLIEIIGGWDEVYPYIYANGIITVGKPYFFINITGGYVKSLFEGNGFNELSHTVLGFAIGGEGRKVLYKGDVLIYRGIQNKHKGEILFLPSFTLGWKSENNRNKYYTGIMTIPLGEVWFPYLSYQRFF